MRKLLVALVAAGLTAGCSAPVEAPAAAEPIKPALSSEAAPSAAAPSAAVVPATLKFTGKTLDGKSFDAAQLAGKPTILWFWAPWCATCASEAQSISDLYDEYEGRLSILGVAGMGENKAMHEFVSNLEVGKLTHLDDQAGTIWKRFKITQQSWYVFLDKNGKIVKTGYLDDLQLTNEVKTLVA